MKVGILGTGWIADKMAVTLTGLDKKEGIELYAVASRSKEKAEKFAADWKMPKAYGSYQALVEDPAVDLVYIATPHSHHYDNSVMAIEAGKAVLCEKAFTANAAEAKKLIELAHQRKVLITEAIWTRYMPLSLKVNELLKQGVIGEPQQLSASLCYPMAQKERILRPELCGGTLLDIGVYCINFARMYFGTDIEKVTSEFVIGETGMDMQNSIAFHYRDGKMANLQSSVMCRCDRKGLICGSENYLTVDNINCPEKVTVWDDYKPVAEFYPPSNQVTGYEYQVMACRDALRDGLIESPYMPHNETIAIMQQMDELRAEWGVKYPNDLRVL